MKKCEARGIVFGAVDQFFPEGLAGELRPHLHAGLARLSAEPLPRIEVMLDETRGYLRQLFAE